MSADISIKIPCFLELFLNILLKQRTPLLLKYKSVIHSLLWTELICLNSTCCVMVLGGGTFGMELGLGLVRAETLVKGPMGPL